MVIKMLITKLYLGHFGKFCNREIDFEKGINILYGENEAGKSTIHAFIRGMLFGIEPTRKRSTKEDMYTKYLPWDYPGAYDGRMDIVYQGVPYQIKRSFLKTDKSFSVINLDTGRDVELPTKSITDLIEGLTEATYRNTISIEQLKAKTDEDLANQLRNYITNLSVSRSNEVDVGEALTFLTAKKKQMDAMLKSDELGQLQEQIELGIQNEKKIDILTLRLKELIKKEQSVKLEQNNIQQSVSDEMREKMDRLPAIIEKYRQFVKLDETGKDLDIRYSEVVKKREQAQKEKTNIAEIEKAIHEIDKLHEEIDAIEEQEREITLEQNRIQQKERRRNLLLSFVPSATIAILGIVLFGNTKGAIWVVFGALLCALLLYLAFTRLTENKQNVFDEQMKQFMQQILSRNGRKRQLLLDNNVLEYLELINKHQRLLKQVYSYEYLEQRVADLSRRRDNILMQTDELYSDVLAYMQSFLPEEVLTDETMEKLTTYIQNKKQHLSVQTEQLNQVYQSCHLELEKVRWELSLLEGNEENLFQNQATYKELLKKREEIEEERKAIQLALEAIEELSVDIHDGFGHELNVVVNEMLSKVTNGKYDDIKIDEKLNMKVGHNGTYVRIEDLSAGTMDQIYFSLRVAVADLVLGKNKMPILLDDSFALYDDHRVGAALSYLSNRTQIILFTCHNREEDLLNRLEIKHHFIPLQEEKELA